MWTVGTSIARPVCEAHIVCVQQTIGLHRFSCGNASCGCADEQCSSLRYDLQRGRSPAGITCSAGNLPALRHEAGRLPALRDEVGVKNQIVAKRYRNSRSGFIFSFYHSFIPLRGSPAASGPPPGSPGPACSSCRSCGRPRRCPKRCTDRARCRPCPARPGRSPG